MVDLSAPPQEEGEGEPADKLDLRLAWLGSIAWASALLALLPIRVWVCVVVGAVSASAVALRVARQRSGLVSTTVVAGLAIFVAVGAIAQIRDVAERTDPVAQLATSRASVQAELSVRSDARLREGKFEQYVLMRGRIVEVTGRGRTFTGASDVLVIAPADWQGVRLGSTLEVSGRLAPADRGLSGILTVRGEPRLIEGPDLWWQVAEKVRASLRASVAGRPDEQRSLVPALVVGDDSDMPASLVADFQACGLTHLTAVSGTNLTLLVGFLLPLARLLGVRGRWSLLVVLAGIAGFLILARAEPSVVRAATMGTVALLGMASGRQRGVRALGGAVLALLLFDPGYATNLGFALSVLACAGILFLAPAWRDAMSTWMPRWLAEAIAVPTAAQLACTPLVAAISGQVSLVAVGANLLAAPAVGPTTVLGLVAALVGLVFPFGATILGTLAGWCVGWIVLVATHGATLPHAAVSTATTPWGLAILTGLCLLLALVLRPLLASRVLGLLSCAAIIGAGLVGAPAIGRGPGDWAFAVCDVGQGDALVLNAGDGAGVVVDAGPDPRLVDQCLSRLGISTVPMVLVSHFHADHIGGFAGVVDGREVGEVDLSALADPTTGAEQVSRQTQEGSLSARVPAQGETRRIGPITWQVLWPPPNLPAGPGDGSAANNASTTLLVETHGLRLLLTGDLEPEGQASVAAAHPGLDVDILKVPHHGSSYQDMDWLCSLHPEAALISVGADNDYGHPNPGTIQSLRACGAAIHRTDEEGTIIVTSDGTVTSL